MASTVKGHPTRECFQGWPGSVTGPNNGQWPVLGTTILTPTPRVPGRQVTGALGTSPAGGRTTAGGAWRAQWSLRHADHAGVGASEAGRESTSSEAGRERFCPPPEGARGCSSPCESYTWLTDTTAAADRLASGVHGAKAARLPLPKVSHSRAGPAPWRSRDPQREAETPGATGQEAEGLCLGWGPSWARMAGRAGGPPPPEALASPGSHLWWPWPHAAGDCTPGGTGQVAGHPRTGRRAGLWSGSR